MKDDYNEYVKKNMQEKFVAYRHNNSSGFWGAGVVLRVYSLWSNFEYSPNTFLVFSPHRTSCIHDYS
jgi:hypothetical protein